MITIDVNTCQRTAYGCGADAVTTIYAMGLTAIADDTGVYLDTADWTIEYPDIYQTYATIRIHHPLVIWGNYNDIMQDCYRIAMHELLDSGVVVYNDYYTPVWALDMEASDA